jgi:hypothetical protein
MRMQNYLLCYKGHFTHEITKSLLAMTENKLSKEGAETNIRKKIFNVMMGCLQNICASPSDSRYDSIPAIFMLGKNEEEYFIFSGNVINSKDVEPLRKKLLAINMMDTENLRTLFTTMMKALPASEIPESGLGLIDIAKKSGRKLEFDFRQIDEKVSLFSIRTVIATVK